MQPEDINDDWIDREKFGTDVNAYIAKLEETLKNARKARKFWRKEYILEYKDKTHAKHKRCLALAKMCTEKVRHNRMLEVTPEYHNLEPGQDEAYFCRKADLYSKWCKRWLNIAEEFKEEGVK